MPEMKYVWYPSNVSSSVDVERVPQLLATLTTLEADLEDLEESVRYVYLS